MRPEQRIKLQKLDALMRRWDMEVALVLLEEVDTFSTCSNVKVTQEQIRSVLDKFEEPERQAFNDFKALILSNYPILVQTLALSDPTVENVVDAVDEVIEHRIDPQLKKGISTEIVIPIVKNLLDGLSLEQKLSLIVSPSLLDPDPDDPMIALNAAVDDCTHIGPCLIETLLDSIQGVVPDHAGQGPAQQALGENQPAQINPEIQAILAQNVERIQGAFNSLNISHGPIVGGDEGLDDEYELVREMLGRLNELAQAAPAAAAGPDAAAGPVPD